MQNRHRWALLLLGLLWLAVLSTQVGDPPAPLRQEAPPADEQHVFHVGAARVRWQAGPPAEAADAALPSPAWRLVALPHLWRRETTPGEGLTAWYRVGLELPAASPQTPQAVYLPKVSLNAEVWVNGMRLPALGRMEPPVTRHRTVPLLFTLPAPALRAGHNEIWVRVVSHSPYVGHLHTFQVGPEAVLRERHGSRLFWGHTFTGYAAVYNLALGLFVLMVWLRERRQLRYAFFGAACILLGAAALGFRLVDPVIDPGLLQRCTSALYLLGFAGLAHYGLRFSEQGEGLLMRGVNGITLAGLALIALTPDHVYLPTYFAVLAIMSALGLWISAQMLRAMHRRQMPERWVFGPSLLLMAGLGLHDWLEGVNRLSSERFVSFPLALPLLLSGVAWIIAGEYRRAHRDLENLNASLADQLREREKALRHSFEQLAEQGQALAVAQERARILRDMHDGVGAHLSTAIRQVQSPHFQREQLEDSLRGSLERLKLSIDSMNFEHGDVAAMLASFRYRMQPRLEASGVTLDWQLAHLPDWPAGTPEALRHVQFILLEALSNALQHSGSNRFGLSAVADAQAITIAFVDQGRGLQESKEAGGRKGMRERAKLAGATLNWQAMDPGTRVQIRLDLGCAGP